MMVRAFSSILDAIDRGAFPQTRKWFWRGLYGGLSRLWRDEDWRFMNYGYLPEGTPFHLSEQDEIDRPFIGLYAQAVDGLDVTGARVLEVGCGRGGGSRYIARYHQPRLMTGLDYSAGTVRLARRLNADAPNLQFDIGDAEKLPFKDESFDFVINVESSHCYGDVPAFAREVGRVLAPGGWFSFADMRSQAALGDLRRQLSVPGLVLKSENDLTVGVVAALDAAEARKRQMLAKSYFGRSFMVEFAGMQGSMLRRGLSKGEVVYIAQRYRKPVCGVA